MTQLLIIIGYLALLLTLGVASSQYLKRTREDYMLASHSIGPVLLLLSLFGTTMTAFALVGSTGQAFRQGIGVYGMLASSSGIVHSLCFFLIGVKLWAIGRRNGYTTQIQFFRDRLESDAVGMLLFPILVAMVIPYLLLGVISSGRVISDATQGALPSLFGEGGVPTYVASAVICLVVLCYVFFGGMRGTAWANAFQTCVFMFLGVVTFYVIANKLGGEQGFFANLQKATQAVEPTKLSREKVPNAYFASYMLIPLSVGMFPHIFQHWLTAKSADTFKLPIVAHPLLILIVWAPCVLVGAWATAALPAETSPNAVLSLLVNQNAGQLLAGLLTAGILAAIMSSLDSQFMCLGTIFTTDIVQHYGGKGRFSETQLVAAARGFIVLIVVATYLLSLAPPPAVFDLGVWCFSGFTSLFPLAVAALYWRRLTKAGAVASILVTAALWGYHFYQAGFGSDKGYKVFGMLPVATLLAVSTVTLILVSLVTKPPSDKTLERFFVPSK